MIAEPFPEPVPQPLFTVRSLYSVVAVGDTDIRYGFKKVPLILVPSDKVNDHGGNPFLNFS